MAGRLHAAIIERRNVPEMRMPAPTAEIRGGIELQARSVQELWIRIYSAGDGMRTNRQKWETCLHEAGHLVTAMACNGWDCSCHAEVWDGGGLASMPKGLTEFADAAATAAGHYGGLLARLYPVPRKSKPAPAKDVHTQAVREIAGEWIEDAKKSWKRAVKEHDDDELLKRYATATNSMEHKEWGRRLRRARAQARLTVWTHRNEVRAIATILFYEGIFVHHGNPEHDDFFRSRSEADHNAG